MFRNPFASTPTRTERGYVERESATDRTARTRRARRSVAADQADRAGAAWEDADRNRERNRGRRSR